MSESPVLLEAPEALKRLLRLVSRAFYSPEHAIIVNFLMIHSCVKEDDMVEILKFEKKQLRILVQTFLTDKIMKERMRVETSAEGKTTRHSYYFLNYSVFVNVVKYKLDLMRKKIESEERNATSRASFKCPGCAKQFTELEADRLLDVYTGTFICTYCRTEVEEDAGYTPQQDARSLLIKYNEQLQPLFELLREVEDVRLAQSVLEPEPVNVIEKIRSDRNEVARTGPRKLDADHMWSGDRTRNAAGFNMVDTQVTIDLDRKEEKVKEAKERPVWLTDSTIEGASADRVMEDMEPDRAAKPTAGTSKSDEEIMKTLLANEIKRDKPKGLGPIHGIAADDSDDGADSSSSDSDAEVKITGTQDSGKVVTMEMNSDESDDDEVMVEVQGHHVPYSELTDELVAQMTSEEKAKYNRQVQEMIHPEFF